MDKRIEKQLAFSLEIDKVKRRRKKKLQSLILMPIM